MADKEIRTASGEFAAAMHAEVKSNMDRVSERMRALASRCRDLPPVLDPALAQRLR